MSSKTVIIRPAKRVLALAFCGFLAGPLCAQSLGEAADFRRADATGATPEHAVGEPIVAVDWRADHGRDNARRSWPVYRRPATRGIWDRGRPRQHGYQASSRRPFGRYGYVHDGRYWWYMRVPYQRTARRAPRIAQGDRLRLPERRQLRPRYETPRRTPKLLRVPYVQPGNGRSP